MKRTALMTISATVLLSGMTLGSGHLMAQTNTTQSLEEVLAGMTPLQRQALHQLEVTDESGLQLSPSVNLNSPAAASVIVEFKAEPAQSAVLKQALNGKSLSMNEASKNADTAQAAFQKDLKTIYKEELRSDADFYKITRVYKNSINGVAIQLPANQIQQLLQSSAVKAVWSNEEVHIEPPVKQEAVAGDQAVATQYTFPGIDKLHAEGFTGKGIKVGVIDTGVDYNHPDLTDAYKGYRAQAGVDPKRINPSTVKGWDFVDNDADPMETTYDDWQKSGNGEYSGGSPYYTEHGTHVSGIIAGRGKNTGELKVTGVAPDADLYVYRVLGPYGSGSTADILGGIDKAINDGMDVINLSLGANTNNPLELESIALNNAVLAGVTAAVSAGNSGSGMYTLGSPGAGALAITVGASDVSEKIATGTGTLHVSAADATAAATTDLRLLGKGYGDKLEELRGLSLPIVAIPKLGEAADYKDLDVAGKVAYVNRGEIALDIKIKEAAKHGAKAVLLANNTNAGGETFISSYLGESYGLIPTFSLTKASADVMSPKIGLLSTFSIDTLSETVTPGSTLAGFSSRGPARITYDIKPEVTAPGVSTFSSVPPYMHGADQIGNYTYAYEHLSGTSMASPNVAGVAALLLQANPDLTPAQVKETLMNTADPLNDNYSVFEVGAGVVDPYEAIHAQARVEVLDRTDATGSKQYVTNQTGAMAFGTHAPGGAAVSDQRSLYIYNNSNTAKTFNVAVAFQKDRRGSLDAAANNVTITTDSAVTVAASSKKRTDVSIAIPASAALGVYEGYVTYTNADDANEMYQVPFAVRTIVEGIDSFSLSPKAFTRPSDSAYPGQLLYTNGYLKLKSHMRIIDVILTDMDNKEVGYIGSFDGLKMNDNTNMAITSIFSGYYYPFTGRLDHPIAYNPVLTKPGMYRLKLIGTNDEGRTFTTSAAVYFENTAPTFNVQVNNLTNVPNVHGSDSDQDVYEYDPAVDSRILISGSISDKGTEEMMAHPDDFPGVTKRNNFVYYRDPTCTSALLGACTAKVIVPDVNGNFSTYININPTKPMTLEFYGWDAASNKTFNVGKNLYILKKGETYAYMQPEKRAKNMGEALHSTLSLNNASDVKGAAFKFYYNSRISNLLQPEDIVLNPAYSDYFDVTMEQHPNQEGSYNYEATITLTRKEGVEGTLSGNLSLADVAFNLSYDTTVQPLMDQGYLYSVTYTDSADTTKPVLFTGNSASFKIRTYSVLRGSMAAEALYNNYGTLAANPKNLDYSQIGAQVKVTSSNGTEYPVGSYYAASFEVPNLPFTDDTYTFALDIPGHFTIHSNFTIGFRDDAGNITTQNLVLPYNPATAGDVNKDDVIDIMDALYIEQVWGTNDRAADINYDGTVDVYDLIYVLRNYLVSNPTVEFTPNPRQKYQGVEIDNIIDKIDARLSAEATFAEIPDADAITSATKEEVKAAVAEAKTAVTDAINAGWTAEEVVGFTGYYKIAAAEQKIAAIESEEVAVTPVTPVTPITPTDPVTDAEEKAKAEAEAKAKAEAEAKAKAEAEAKAKAEAEAAAKARAAAEAKAKAKDAAIIKQAEAAQARVDKQLKNVKDAQKLLVQAGKAAAAIKADKNGNVDIAKVAIVMGQYEAIITEFNRAGKANLASPAILEFVKVMNNKVSKDVIANFVKESATSSKQLLNLINALKKSKIDTTEIEKIYKNMLKAEANKKASSKQ
ncbi:Fn3-like domain-containing protein [Paenibacillus sp. BC26]|nr:Fn3-like domain-containing protein [Paenibacillus sp. BC26]